MKKYMIELTEEELILYKLVAESEGFGIGTSGKKRNDAHKAAYLLSESLFQRNALPELRVDFLNNPDINIGTKYSVIEEFQKNGTVGKDVFKHPDFIPYLLYLIRGPKLPKSMLEAFEAFLKTEPVFESEDVRTAVTLLRNEIRINKLDPKIASEEILKLAYESGLGATFARHLRDRIHSMRIR